VRPFLLLATRAEDPAADNEYAAFLRFSGLAEHELRRVRLEQAPDQVGPADLDAYSGIILGGSPFTWSVEPMAKTDAQRRVEREIDLILDRVVEEDLPFLGACYGIGTLGGHQGAVIDTTYAEPVSAVEVSLTAAGRLDPLTSVLPRRFEAFVGHKEAITELPDHAVHLAASPDCPVQAFRVGRNVYATQFHPELDVPGIQTRIDVYRHAGYFRPETADDLKAQVELSSVAAPPRLVERFVALYARS
jgi:GMP synthase (glutamine-hydrolysing)